MFSIEGIPLKRGSDLERFYCIYIIGIYSVFQHWTVSSQVHTMNTS